MLLWFSRVCRFVSPLQGLAIAWFSTRGGASLYPGISHGCLSGRRNEGYEEGCAGKCWGPLGSVDLCRLGSSRPDSSGFVRFGVGGGWANMDMARKGQEDGKPWIPNKAGIRRVPLGNVGWCWRATCRKGRNGPKGRKGTRAERGCCNAAPHWFQRSAVIPSGRLPGGTGKLPVLPTGFPKGVDFKVFKVFDAGAILPYFLPPFFKGF